MMDRRVFALTLIGFPLVVMRKGWTATLGVYPSVYHWAHVNVAPFRRRGGTVASRFEIALRSFAAHGMSSAACIELRRLVAKGERVEAVMHPGFHLDLMMTLSGEEVNVVCDVAVEATRYDVVAGLERYIVLNPGICENWCFHKSPPTPPCLPVCSTGPCPPHR